MVVQQRIEDLEAEMAHPHLVNVREGEANTALGRIPILPHLAVLAAHLIGNLRLIDTPDDYAQTVTYLATETRGREISIASDHDVRNKAVLDFYARDLPEDKRLDYRSRARFPESGTEWYLRHSWATLGAPVPHIRVAEIDYHLVKSFAHGQTSGYQWFIYRRGAPALSD